jgi:hypothetical protein
LPVRPSSMPSTRLFFSFGVNPCDIISSAQTQSRCYVRDSPVVEKLQQVSWLRNWGEGCGLLAAWSYWPAGY